MSVLVSVQVIGPAESPTTYITNVGLKTSVDPHVYLQVRSLSKSFTTYVTLIRSFTSVAHLVDL